jgi:small multidrug resistance family-3 protein
MLLIRTIGLFVLTALAEILGCYLPYLWLKRGGSAWLLILAAFSLALFAWLLTLHPAAAGRIYADLHRLDGERRRSIGGCAQS